MKKIIKISMLFIIMFCGCLINNTTIHTEGLVFALEKENSNKFVETPLLAIVIDDFGGYDRSGVKSMLSVDAPLTCAIMPNLDYSTEDMENAVKANKEVILHMPMQSHVNLPESWYGPVYIYNNDTPKEAIAKLENCLKSIPYAKGFNIHIGSGVSQNSILMKAIIDYAKANNLFFLDSRTHIGTICENVAAKEGFIYLGRDEFLEPDHNKSYDNVKKHLLIGRDLALEKGYAIVIGHVGAHGGENTVRAIKDSLKEIKDSGVEIVPLSKIYEKIEKLMAYTP